MRANTGGFMIEFDGLKRLAEAATPGPWDVAVWTCGVRGCEVKRDIDRIGCDLHFPNAAYIAAANPATILALIARLEAAEADRQKAVDSANAAADAIESLTMKLQAEEKRMDWAFEKHARFVDGMSSCRILGQ